MVEFPVTLHSGSSALFRSPGVQTASEMNTDCVALVVRPRAERRVQKILADIRLETFCQPVFAALLPWKWTAT